MMNGKTFSIACCCAVLVSGIACAAPSVSTGRQSELNVPSVNLRENSARDYVAGILGGDIGRLLSSRKLVDMERYGFSLWLRAAAYPATTWAWSQAVIDNVSVSGDDVVIAVTKPVIYSHMNTKRPRCLEEWKFYLDVTNKNSSLVKSIERKSAKRKLVIDGAGHLAFQSGYEKVFAKVEEDFLRALQVVRETRDTRFREYISGIADELEASSTIKAPANVRNELALTLKTLDGKVETKKRK